VPNLRLAGNALVKKPIKGNLRICDNPRTPHFPTLQSVWELVSEPGIVLVRRGGGITDQESRLMLDQAIVTGRGGVFLNLTAEEYAKLER
jgi:hypothetical protein